MYENPDLASVPSLSGCFVYTMRRAFHKSTALPVMQMERSL